MASGMIGHPSRSMPGTKDYLRAQVAAASRDYAAPSIPEGEIEVLDDIGCALVFVPEAASAWQFRAMREAAKCHAPVGVRLYVVRRTWKAGAPMPPDVESVLRLSGIRAMAAYLHSRFLRA